MSWITNYHWSSNVTIDIVEWAQGKTGFYVDRHYTAGGWVLVQSPIKLADYHADILRHCFTPDESGRLPYDVVAWCEPAKSGKSAIAGLVAEYIALHGEQNSQIVMASNKRDQAASIMFRSLTDSIEYNPHLPNVDPGRYEVSFRNGTAVKAIASNSRGEAGARFSLATFDELWGYQYVDSERLWTEFKTDPTRLNSVKLAIARVYNRLGGPLRCYHLDQLGSALAGIIDFKTVSLHDFRQLGLNQHCAAPWEYHGHRNIKIRIGFPHLCKIGDLAGPTDIGDRGKYMILHERP